MILWGLVLFPGEPCNLLNECQSPLFSVFANTLFSLRCLIVYPWTQRYFGSFGNLYNAAAIASNPKVAAHGKVVLGGLEKALKNMDDIKQAYADLSVLHSETLQVDPDNFKLLADCLTIVVASQLGKDFTPEVHAAFAKFLAVVVAALRKQYH
uniref:Globin domain-containing protein n=1 Tax=Oryzias sinensis TaxID=183150 RepID=A0A8C7ZAC7_9TELE